MRLHTHDIIDPPIEVGATAKYLDGDDGFFDMVGITLSPFGYNVVQKMAQVRSFPERFRVQYPIQMSPNFSCADCFRRWKSGHFILSL
jgi:hypothetical protein